MDEQPCVQCGTPTVLRVHDVPLCERCAEQYQRMLQVLEALRKNEPKPPDTKSFKKHG